MKKLIKLVLIAMILTLVLLPALVACNSEEAGTSSNSKTEKLVIYNWEDYIDPTLLDDFCEYYEEVTGNALEITYTTFDTNETMMTKVIKGDANVDLICPSEYSIQKLLVAGCLLNQYDMYQELKPTLDKYGITLSGLSSIKENITTDSEGNITKSGNIEPFIINKIQGAFSSITANDGNTYNMLEYMVPYLWGTLGILYNVNYVTQEELDEYGWGVLWNVEENESIENMILMKDSVRDTYAAALFYLYQYDLLPEKYKNLTADELINCTDDEVIALAEQVLTEQRDHISGYEVDFGKDDMLNEIVYVDFAWSGDALWAIEESYDEETDEYLLDYYVPTCCSNIWYDGWVTPTTCSNKLAALMFIDYCASPMGGIRNSMEVGYTTAVAKDILANDQEVCDFIEENDYSLENIYEDGELVEYGYFDDIRRYPKETSSEEGYVPLGMMQDFGDRNDTVVNMWQRAKSGSSVEHSLWYIILIIVGVILLVILIYILVQKAKLRPRKIHYENTEKNIS